MPDPTLHRRLPCLVFLSCLLSLCLPVKAAVIYLDNGTPLVGMSGEYLPHVQINHSFPRYADTCTLDNYDTSPYCFFEMNMAAFNKTQLVVSLNSSEGMDDGFGQPYSIHEQPFFWNGVLPVKWNLTRFDPAPGFFENLNNVITAAANQGLQVEVTLFDQWDGQGFANNQFPNSPWNPANTRNAVGFTKALFLTAYNNPTGTGKDPSGSQDDTARAAQMGFIAFTVQQLAAHPNIIWEVANEPDVPLVDPTLTFTRANYVNNLLHWHEDVVKTIVANDSNISIHPISVNLANKAVLDALVTEISSGKFDNPSCSLSPSGHNTCLKMLNGHYVRRMGTFPNSLGPSYGAPEIIQTYGAPASPLLPLAFGFNESRDTPDAGFAARAEAWEFMVGGGASYDNYSLGLGPVNPLANTMVDTISYLTNLESFLLPLAPSLASRENNQNGLSPSWISSATPSIAYGNNHTYWGSIDWNRRYALYVHHSCPGSIGNPGPRDLRYVPLCSSYQNTFTLSLTSGAHLFNVEWFTPDSNQPICTQVINWQGSPITVKSPPYAYDLALRVRWCGVSGVTCATQTDCSGSQFSSPPCPTPNPFPPDTATCKQ